MQATRDDIVLLLTGAAPFIKQMSPRLQDQLNKLGGCIWKGGVGDVSPCYLLKANSGGMKHSVAFAYAF